MRKVNTILVILVAAIALAGIILQFTKRPSLGPKDKIPTDEQYSPRPAYGDTIIQASIGDASYLNPILASDSASGDINGYVYNGLVKYDKNLKLVGDLAESWDVSEEGLVITFHLRKNVKWHDGKPFTSEDVKFTYDKLVNPNTKTPYASDYLIVQRLEIVDPHTVRIRYKEPFSPGLESWGMGIVPRHIFERGDFNNHPANRQPIGTGPYKFIEWKTDEQIVLEANDDYFEGRPYIDRIIYRIVPDQAVQFLELRRGTIDTMGLTPDQYQKEATGKEFLDNFNKFRYPGFGYTYMGYNLKNPLFNDKRVRQAITYAINRREIIDGILLGLGQISTGPFPPTSWAYNKDVPVYEHNLEKAKELLYNSGWQDTDGDGILDKGGRPFSFTLMTNQGNKMRELCATIIQSNLRKVGIRVAIRILEWASFIHQYVDKKNFDAVILGWSLSRDPDQYTIWHSSQIKEGQYNFVSYGNPEVDRLLVEGRRTFDMERRREIYNRIHAILADEQPYTFLYVADALPVVQKRFHGIEVAPAGIGYNFIKWYVPKDQQKYTR